MYFCSNVQNAVICLISEEQRDKRILHLSNSTNCHLLRKAFNAFLGTPLGGSPDLDKEWQRSRISWIYSEIWNPCSEEGGTLKTKWVDLIFNYGKQEIKTYIKFTTDKSDHNNHPRERGPVKPNTETKFRRKGLWTSEESMQTCFCLYICLIFENLPFLTSSLTSRNLTILTIHCKVTSATCIWTTYLRSQCWVLTVNDFCWKYGLWY